MQRLDDTEGNIPEDAAWDSGARTKADVTARIAARAADNNLLLFNNIPVIFYFQSQTSRVTYEVLNNIVFLTVASVFLITVYRIDNDIFYKQILNMGSLFFPLFIDNIK